MVGNCTSSGKAEDERRVMSTRLSLIDLPGSFVFSLFVQDLFPCVIKCLQRCVLLSLLLSICMIDLG